MAQKPQIIDITKSYLPGDPNSFVHNLVNTDREDGEEKAFPVLPYEGYNFLPTSYGYRSYFGLNAKLNLTGLPSRAQHVILWQLPTFESRLIALCEDGIWVAYTNNEYPDWVQLVSHSYDSNVFEEWTWCIIENILYMYKQGKNLVYKTSLGSILLPILGSKFLGATSTILGNSESNSGSWESWELPYKNTDLFIDSFTPSFLNMSGQLGIFKAGLRLGFWDSSNSISWSSNLDLSDFTPSLENLAGNTIFGAVVGRVVLCKSHGEGFIVYSTKSVVGVSFSAQGNLLWDAKKILDSSGIISSRNVTVGATDYDHYVYTTSGLYTIGSYNAITGSYEEKAALTELYDFLKESKDPVALHVLQDRYICFSLVDSDYIYGKKSFHVGITNPYETQVEAPFPTSTTDTILPAETLWELIASDMTFRSYRTDNRKWIPLYNTEVDRIDTRYYAAWMLFRPGSETTGLTSYDVFDTALNTVPITAGIITGLVPAAVSSKFGTIRNFTGIRAFPNTYGGDLYDNNESLIAGQISEWDHFVKHMTANADKLESIIDTQHSTIDSSLYDVGNGYTVLSRNAYSYPTHSTKVLGSVINGNGNLEWFVTRGPAEDAAIEVILRKTFNKLMQVTQDVVISYTGTAGGDWTLDSSSIAPFVDIDDIYFLNNITGSCMAVFLQGVNIKRYTVSGNPGVSGSYTLNGTNDTTEFLDSLTLGIAKSPSNVYYLSLYDAGQSLWYSNNGYSWTQFTSGSSYIPNFETGVEFLGSDFYQVTYNSTALKKGVISGSTLTSYTSVATSGLSLTSTSRKSMLKISGVLYIVEFLGTNVVKVWSSPDAVNWTLVSSTSSLTQITPTDKIVIGAEGRIVGIASSNIREYKVTATTLTRSAAIGSVTYAAHYVNSDTLYLCVVNATNTGFEAIYVESLTGTQDAVITYQIDEIDQNTGYSQFRTTITHWDLIEPGLYGNYTLIERVPASAMTPAVWSNHYPEDQGSGRNQIQRYGFYKAQQLVDLQAGTNGKKVLYPEDPNATANLTLSGYTETGVSSSYILPGSSFILQTGSIEISYPTYTGALVYDLQLKKWGKFRGDHQTLVELLPINTEPNSSLSYSELGVIAGILDPEGFLYIFDQLPLDSWIRFGKIGYYRLGMTQLCEVRVEMRNPADFAVDIQSSLLGKILDLDISSGSIGYFNQEVEGILLVDVSARWHSILVSGNYDLTGLEVRGVLAGRR